MKKEGRKKVSKQAKKLWKEGRKGGGYENRERRQEASKEGMNE